MVIEIFMISVCQANIKLERTHKISTEKGFGYALLRLQCFDGRNRKQLKSQFIIEES